MTSEYVSRIIATSLNFATMENLEIAVSVVDKGGHLMGFLRTENSSFAAIAVSKRKAVSACVFGLPTDVIGALVQKKPFMERAFAGFDDIFYFGGGVPIVNGNTIVGGIGISGADPEQDKALAEKVLLALLQEE